MKIYINDFVHPVKAEILPSDTPTQDETLETFSFVLMSNDNPLPYAPMQKVKVEFSEDDIAYFYIVSDSVETYSLNPLSYKHTLTCIQNTRELSKHLVRNSVFTQPPDNFKSSINATSQYNFSELVINAPVTWDNPLLITLNTNSKALILEPNQKPLNTAKLKISFQYIYGDPRLTNATMISDAHTLQDIESVTGYSDLSIASQLTLKYIDANNNDQTESILPSQFGETVFDLNKIYDFPRINYLISQGCNNFEILFDSADFVSGGITGSTITTTLILYMVQASIELEVYSFSAYDILDILIKRQKREDSISINVTPLFVLPEDTNEYTTEQRNLARLLKNTVAPNFTFTQLTMYECVAEVFRLFDAIFTMDEDNVLGIEYFNDLSNEPIQPKLAGRVLSIGEDKYTDKLVAYYQDGRYEETFPKNNLACLRSTEFGVPDEQDHNFIVPHNIYIVKKCELECDEFRLAIPNPEYPATYMTVSAGIVLDITRHVVDQTLWSTLNVGAITYPYNIAQGNSIYYSRGDNKIQCAYTYKNSWGGTQHAFVNMVICSLAELANMVGTSIFEPSGNVANKRWNEIKMRATYIATVDGKTQIHSLINKYDGETLIDQNNGAVDLNKMGLNMIGLSLKLGNPTLNATHKITSWNKRIRKGQIYEWTIGNETTIWVANVVNYTFLNGMIRGKISFAQNFNQLSLITRLLQEKRISNISQELVTKSEEIITDFIYFSTKSITEGNGDLIHFDYAQLVSFITQTFNFEGPYPAIRDAFVYQDSDIAHPYTNAIYIPMISYGAGNTINFEMSFDHPMNAGNQTKATAPNWLGISKYFTTYVKYTDDYGYLDLINIETPKIIEDYTDDFPKAQISLSAGFYFLISNFKVYKQPNEIFALNYQLTFLPIPNRQNIDFIGSEFINNNCFVKRYENTKKTRYICFMAQKSSNLDLKVTDYLVKKEITGLDYTYVVANYKLNIEFTFDTLTAQDKETGTFKSWAIVDENDNVLFASNNMEAIVEDNTFHLYFMPKRTRLI